MVHRCGQNISPARSGARAHAQATRWRKWLVALIAALAVTGCVQRGASSSPARSPAGEQRYQVWCSGGRELCHDEAWRVCPTGYDLVDSPQAVNTWQSNEKRTMSEREWYSLFMRMRELLVGKYGSWSSNQGVPAACRSKDLECLDSEQFSYQFVWKWEDGSSVLLRLRKRPTASTRILVAYWSSAPAPDLADAL